MRALIVVACLCLTGCAGPALQRVEVPVAVSCVKTVLTLPALPAVPPQGIFEQAKALVVRDKLRAGYEGELLAVIEACR